MAEYEDKTITCVECGQPFVHSAGAQEFYAQKGFTSDPKRCPDCRRQKKERSAGGAGAGAGGGPRGGGEYARPARSSTSENDALFGGGRGSRGGGPGAGAVAEAGPGGREMYSAVCAECGTETKVPFRPRGDRPVYCRNCYQAKRAR